MQQRKIIHLLKILSEEEIKAFERFVSSPFFNENKRLVSLLDYLTNFAPLFDNPEMNEADAYTYVFEDSPYVEKRLVRLLSKLCKLMDQFVEHYGLLASQEVGFSFRLTFYEQKNQAVLFEQQLKSFRQWLKENPPKHHRYEHARFNLEKSQSNFLHRKQQYSSGDVNLQEAMMALDHYYLVEKLMLATAMYNRQAVLPVSYSPFFLDNMLTELREKLDDFSPTVQIWYRALCMVREPDSKEIYFQLKAELLAKLEKLDEEDGLALFLILQNSLHKAIGQQSEMYFQELFELYKVQIQQNWILSRNGTILLNVFKNIVTVGTTIGEVDWTKKFIKSYQGFLTDENKDDMMAYAFGQIAFKEKAYDKAIKSISQASQKNIFLALSIRRLQLKIYYEQKDWEALISAINSYRVYLHRLTRLSPRHKEVNTFFLNLLSALSRFDPNQDEEKKILSIEDEIQQTSLLPERTWLLEKVEEIRVLSS